MLTVDYGGGGGGGGGGLVVDYVIKIFIFFINFCNTNWTIFVDFVIKIFIFTNFEKKMSAYNEQGSMNRGEKWFSEKL